MILLRLVVCLLRGHEWGGVLPTYHLAYVPGGRDYDAPCLRCGHLGRWNERDGYRA